MSLSPFDSFQSRFVSYLLNCPRSLGVCPTERHTKYLHGSESKLTVSNHSSGHINRFWLFLDADPTV
jgi:hypothetical protein